MMYQNCHASNTLVESLPDCFTFPGHLNFLLFRHLPFSHTLLKMILSPIPMTIYCSVASTLQHQFYFHGGQKQCIRETISMLTVLPAFHKTCLFCLFIHTYAHVASIVHWEHWNCVISLKVFLHPNMHLGFGSNIHSLKMSYKESEKITG